MAIQMSEGFSLLSKKPLDGRFLFESLEEMKNVPEDQCYNGCLAHVKTDNSLKRTYQFWDTNSIDKTTGKWRVYKDLSPYLNKNTTTANVFKARFQIGEYKDNIANAFTHIRNVGDTSITGKVVNGAAFSVNMDGTASFMHKLYDDNGTNARNAAVLRFYGDTDKSGKLQFAINTGDASTPTEDMFKTVAFMEDILPLLTSSRNVNNEDDGRVTPNNLMMIPTIMNGTEIAWVSINGQGFSLYAPKPDIPVKYSFELNPENWNEDKTYVINNIDINCESTVIINPSPDINLEQYNKLQSACIITFEQSTNLLKLKALGEVPNETIPVKITIINSKEFINKVNEEIVEDV